MSRQPVFQPTGPFKEIVSVGELSTAIRWLYENGIHGGEPTGWPSLDQSYTVRLREWTLITGVPGHGKSAFLDGLMVNLASAKDWNWAVFSAENLPLERHCAGLIAQFIGKPFTHGMRTRLSQSDLNKAMLFIERFFRFVKPSEDNMTVDRILDVAHLMSTTECGIQGLVIDPWNELDHTRPAHMTETEYVSRSLSKIRRFARDHEVHVFLVAHPVKLQRDKNGCYPVPTPYDVSGSAHFRNKADNCLCVWRDMDNPGYGADIHVQKIRFSEVGKVGLVHMGYDSATGQMIDSLRYRREPGDENDEELGR